MMFGQAFADSIAPPKDYKVVTENSEFVFIMLVPEQSVRWATLNPDIRNTYSKSGLYRNDGSNTPLWTIDWYAYSVMPVSDGIHMIRSGPWASSMDDLAFAFYRNGQELKSYKVKDQVKREWLLPRSVSHFTWRDKVEYQESKGNLYVSTLGVGHSYNFSITTGEIRRDFVDIISTGFSDFLAILINSNQPQ
jgi:hypothetical protein